MVRHAFVLFLCSLPLFAQTSQFKDLAATADGAQLYFSSPLRQRGTDQLPQEKLFRLVSTGFELFDQRLREYPVGGPNTSTYYRLIQPAISGDGAILAYVAERDCVGGSGCAFVERYESTVVGASLANPVVFNGRAQLSRNGRYVLQYGSTSIFPQTSVRNLQTGEHREFPKTDRILGTQALTNTGGVLVFNDAGLTLRRPDDDIAIAGTDTHAAAVDAAGTVVVRQNNAGLLIAHHLDTNQQAILGAGDAPVITDDGSLILYLAKPFIPGSSPPVEVFVIHSDGTAPRQLTGVPEGVTAATISGNGNLVYAVTTTGRMLRVNVGTADDDELVPPTPLPRDVAGAPVPGSLNWIHGAGLAVTKEVRLNGETVPMFYATDDEIAIQIPFDAELGLPRLDLIAGDSPFEAAYQYPALQETRPLFIQIGRELPVIPGLDYGPVIVNRDFTALINQQNPAHPGDVLTFYMTGAGPVTPPLATGVPAPLDTLHWAAKPLACTFSQPDNVTPAPLLFLGLAPGMTGVYQYSTRLPEHLNPHDFDPSRGDLYLDCEDVVYIPVAFP